MDRKSPVVTLDWSQLLGFDQATPQVEAQGARAEPEKQPLPKLGAKVGTKSARLSVGPLSKLGAKVGNKKASLSHRGLTKLGAKGARARPRDER